MKLSTSPTCPGEIQHPLDASSVARRGKVKWGRGWWDVEEMGTVWVFVKGGLRVAPASLKTLVCHDQDATSLQLPSDEKDRNLGSSGDGDEEEVEDAARRRKNAAQARQPAQRCGVDGCEYETKDKSNLKKHQARVHGVGDMDAEELRRKQREARARQPAQRCGVDGCEHQSKHKSNLKAHQALVHGIAVFQHDDAPFGHAEVALNDVVVPVSEALIANEGDGFAIAQARLGPGRIHHCMRAIGLGRRCHELMVERSLVRTAFGKPLLRHGMTQEKVADSLAALECARAITLVCADKIDKVGAKNARDSIAMIKYKVPELVLKIIDDAIQVHGAAGVSEDTCLAQAYSYMRTLRIADGPDEVHKMTVARIESKRAIGRLKAKL